MARSHDPNRLETHIHIMERQIDRYAYAFDDSFVETIPFGSPDPIDANRLHFDDQVNEYLCLGEFRFSRASDHDHWVLLSYRKTMHVQEHGGMRFSHTFSYAYNIRLDSPKNADQKRTRILRFDNRDLTGYGYSTKHHLHIQVESGAKRFRVHPYPAHVDINYPYLSDAFEICIHLAANPNGPTQRFDELLARFDSIPKASKANPVDWVPPMKFDLLDFIL